MKKSKKFKKIKLILITIILLIAVVFGVKYIKDNHYIFLYINPNNNTNTYPYISKATNQINELLNIEFPIFQGGMANIATGEFAAAVSAAGGEIAWKDLDDAVGICMTIPLGGEECG